jgi:hypothetical protein
MRQIWTKVHKNDHDPCPAPICFASEDYLSSLMVVDAMAECPDVEKWYPPLIKYLMVRQDIDGGLRIQDHISCHEDGPGTSCWCGKGAREPQFCPSQKSWCSKDRTFITAAGTMMLLADTPYRAAFMSTKVAHGLKK